MTTRIETIELWLVEYKTEAYQDQTGRWQKGYLVHERLTVDDTGKRYDVDDGYKNWVGHGRVYRGPGRRTFKVQSDTVSGFGTSVIPNRQAPAGKHWSVAPRTSEGYAYPNGTPVKR